jgi:glycosyltransferase involved in cell wall biosynthesis
MGSHDSASSVTVLLNVWAGDDVHRLEKSLESVFSQTLQNFYLLVVSDGPLPPETEALLKNFQIRESSISMKHVRSLPQMGLWHVRNYGISLIQTAYTALHDADDIMHPERLEIQLDSMSKGSIDVLGSSVFEFDPETDLITGFRTVPVSHSEIRSLIKSRNPIHHSSVMLRTSIISEATRYRDIYLTEDYDLWIRLMGKSFMFENDLRPLVAFCRDAKLLNRRGGRKFITAEIRISFEIIQNRLNNSVHAVLHFFLRVAYRMGPKKLRQMVHSRWINSDSDPHPKTVSDFLVANYL